MQRQIQPPPLPQPMPAPQVQMRQGRYFSFPLPPNWRFNETDCGVDLMAPDGMTIISHTLLRGPGSMTPDQMLRMLMHHAPQLGMTNLRVIKTQPVSVAGGGVGMAYETTCLFKGVPARGVTIFRVFNSFGQYSVDTTSIQTHPHIFDHNLHRLMQLDQRIAVTNPNQVCGNDKLIRFQPPPPVSASRGSSNPIGDMIVKGEQERNRIRDHIHQHDTDVRRGVTRWGEDGSIVAPNTAERVFVTPGGTAYYSNQNSTPPPLNATEVNPYR